jgi:hypothetical protein
LKATALTPEELRSRVTISVPELAATIGVGINTAYQLCVQGVLPARKLGGRWLVSGPGVAAMFEPAEAQAPEDDPPMNLRIAR